MARDVNWAMMATMADRWTDDTSAMLSIAIGLVMEKLGVTEVEIDLSRTGEIVDTYLIDRHYFLTDTHPVMRVTMTKREDENALQDNPASQTGNADSVAGTEPTESPGTV